jgi:thioredoxin reductase (NADPH)
LFNLSSLKPAGKPEPDEDVYDVAIIGGGPAGATAALYAARANLRTVVLDKNPAAGALAVTSKIANYPGVPRVLSGPELLQIMREQAESFGAEFKIAQALSTELHSSPKVVHTSAGPVKAKAVIVATGKMGRKDKVPGEEEFLGRGVSYCATCDAAFFRDQAVAVIGASREAVEETRFVTQFASKVYLLAPGDKFHAPAEELEEVERDPKVEVRRKHVLKEVIGDGAVSGVRVAASGEQNTLPVSGVFVYLPGNLPIIDFLDGQIETTESGCVRTNHERATNVPGVYAVGDVVCSYIQQAVVAAADGAIAAMAAEKHIRGRAKARSDWA